MTYLAFVLDAPSRARLLEELSPKFTKVVAHHVTLVFPTSADEAAKARRLLLQLAGQEHDVEVISHYVGEHIEAVGVTFNGVRKRPNGGFYHVTLSLEPPAKPKDSNTLTNPALLSKPFKLTGAVQLVD